MAYAYPTDTDFVSCSWQCHRDRNPPSSEPGTDYGSGYGSPVYAADNGVVSDRKTSYSNATGAYVTVDLDDGRRVRTLHCDAILANVGQRVNRGDQIAVSGASGYGDPWYYGPHAHQTAWDCHCYNFCSSCTIDFDTLVGGGSTPEPVLDLEDEMIRIQATNRGIALIGPGYFRALSTDEEVQQSEPIISKHITGNDRQFDLWASMATSGNSAVPYPFTSTLADDQIAAIAEGVVAALPDVPGGGASAEEVRKIVSDALASLVLVSQAVAGDDSGR